MSGGMRHDPQRFMGKTVTVPHFNRETVEFASRESDESNPGIKTLLPFLKNITEESDLENFQDLTVALDACYWLNKAISISLSRFGDNRRCDLADFKRWQWNRSVVHTWICLTKNLRPLVVFIYLMDFITSQGGGARANSKVRNRLS